MGRGQDEWVKSHFCLLFLLADIPQLQSRTTPHVIAHLLALSKGWALDPMIFE